MSIAMAKANGTVNPTKPCRAAAMDGDERVVLQQRSDRRLEHLGPVVNERIGRTAHQAKKNALTPKSTTAAHDTTWSSERRRSSAGRAR